MATSVPSPQKATAAACARLTCDGCELQGHLMCIHTPADVADFGVLFMTWAIPFFAGMILGRHWRGLVAWLGLAAAVFIPALLPMRGGDMLAAIILIGRQSTHGGAP